MLESLGVHMKMKMKMKMNLCSRCKHPEYTHHAMTGECDAPIILRATEARTLENGLNGIGFDIEYADHNCLCRGFIDQKPQVRVQKKDKYLDLTKFGFDVHV